VTRADVTDHNDALVALNRSRHNLQQVTSVLAGGAHSGEPLADTIQQSLGATVQTAKRSELYRFVVMPQRWIVERSLAWLSGTRQQQVVESLRRIGH